MSSFAVVLLAVMGIAGIVVAVLAVQYATIPWVRERRRVLAAVRPIWRFTSDLERSHAAIERAAARARDASPEERRCDDDLARIRYLYAFARSWSDALTSYAGDLRAFGFPWFLRLKLRQETTIPSPAFGDPPSLGEFTVHARTLATLDRPPEPKIPDRPSSWMLAMDSLAPRRERDRRAPPAGGSASPNPAAAAESNPTAGSSQSPEALKEERDAWVRRVTEALRLFGPAADAAQRVASGDAMRIDVNAYGNALVGACKALATSGDPEVLREARRTIGMRSRILQQFATYYAGTHPSVNERWVEVAATLAQGPR